MLKDVRACQWINPKSAGYDVSLWLVKSVGIRKITSWKASLVFVFYKFSVTASTFSILWLKRSNEDNLFLFLLKLQLQLFTLFYYLKGANILVMYAVKMKSFYNVMATLYEIQERWAEKK